MTEKRKIFADNGITFAALLTDLSKVFDCLQHDLTIAKPNGCGLSLSCSRLIHSYLSNQEKRTKINSVYNSWKEVLFGVPQGSIIRPILFNIVMCDLFPMFYNIDFANYGNDTVPYGAKYSRMYQEKYLEDSL